VCIIAGVRYNRGPALRQSPALRQTAAIPYACSTSDLVPYHMLRTHPICVCSPHNRQDLGTFTTDVILSAVTEITLRWKDASASLLTSVADIRQAPAGMVNATSA
jgi:hypothetical protein